MSGRLSPVPEHPGDTPPPLVQALDAIHKLMEYEDERRQQDEVRQRQISGLLDEADEFLKRMQQRNDERNNQERNQESKQEVNQTELLHVMEEDWAGLDKPLVIICIVVS